MNDRRAHQCHYRGCDSEAAFEVHLRIMVIGASGSAAPLDMKSTTNVCDRHRTWAASWLLSPANRELIAKGLAEHGIGTPDFSCPEVHYHPLKPPVRSVIEIQTAPMCDRAGCSSRAAVQIALKLWDIGQKKKAKPNVALTNYCVCEVHANGIQAQDVLAGSGKSKLLGDLTQRGMPMPDFRKTEVELVPLKGGRRMDPSAFVRHVEPIA